MKFDAWKYLKKNFFFLIWKFKEKYFFLLIAQGQVKLNTIKFKEVIEGDEELN